MNKNDTPETEHDWTLDAEGSNEAEIGAALAVGEEVAISPDDGDLSPEAAKVEELRRLAMSPQIQELWKAVLPLVGVQPARPGEYAGAFKVEPVPGKDEATIYIDVPAAPYERGVPSKLDRVLSLHVKLEHDYRRLGEHHYCVDCEVPGSETRH